MNTREIIKFLSDVWSKHCQEGEYVFICTKDPKKKWWKDHPIKYGSGMQFEIRRLLKTYSPEKYDLYFCPLPFKEAVRDKSGVTRLGLLWQDLDYADPSTFDSNLEPTIYWESSPKRFHGLWELDKSYPVDLVEKLNRDLAYEVGADKGGWDLTQVLRIPGTRNHKYQQKPIIELKPTNGRKYRFDDLRKRIPEQPDLMTNNISISNLEEGDPKEILNKWASKLPRPVLTLLLQKEPAKVGERSDKLWYLENKLYEIGLTPDEIFTLIKHSVWNKYRGRRDEDLRIQKEMEKIISESFIDPINEPPKIEIVDNTILSSTGTSFTVESYKKVMSNIRSYPGWLVEGFWARRSHGIVAGEPKSFKSTYVMDLALSVASGEPFLGKFPVLEPGPVIYVQNENSDWIIKDRMEKIAANRNLAGKVSYDDTNKRKLNIIFPRSDLPFYFINQQGFLLNDTEHQALLEKFIQTVKPVLIVFDPLYLMFDGDVNSAKDLNPVLNWMLKIKNEYHTGVIVIHHYNKGGSNNHWRGGQRMLGSTTLHGWIESAWYIQRKEPESEESVEIDKQSRAPSKVILDREFRNAGQYPKLELSLVMGEMGNPVYNISAEPVMTDEEQQPSKRTRKTPEELAKEIEEILEENNGNYTSWQTLQKITGHGKKELQEAADFLVSGGKYIIEKSGIKRG